MMKLNYLLTAARLLISAAFLFSAWSKLIAPGIFEITIVDQGLMPDRPSAAILARLVIGLEIAIALLYLQTFFKRRFVSYATLGLLLVFSVHLVYLMAIGDNENCGCFGELLEMSPHESILKNIVLMGLVVFVIAKGKRKGHSPILPIAIACLALPAAFLFVPIKTTDAHSFAQYTQFEGKGRVDLGDGDKLLAILNLDCEHCQDAARDIADLKAEMINLPETYALFYSEGEMTVREFKDLTGSEFPYHMIGIEEFVDYIGNAPPRIYWLRDGAIHAFWDEDFARYIRQSFAESSQQAAYSPKPISRPILGRTPL